MSNKIEHYKKKVQLLQEEIWEMELVIAYQSTLETKDAKTEVDKANFRISVLQPQLEFISNLIKKHEEEN